MLRYGRLATYASRVYQAMSLAPAAKFAIRTSGVLLRHIFCFFTRYWFSWLGLGLGSGLGLGC